MTWAREDEDIKLAAVLASDKQYQDLLEEILRDDISEGGDVVDQLLDVRCAELGIELSEGLYRRIKTL